MRLHRRLGFWGMFLTLGAVSLALSFRGGPLAAYAYALDSDADGLSNDFEDAYGYLERLGARLEAGLAAGAKAAGIPLTVTRAGSTLTPFFLDAAPRNWSDASKADRAAFSRFHGAMLEAGVHLPPSQFEAWFLSLAHTEADVDATIEAASRAFVAARG